MLNNTVEFNEAKENHSKIFKFKRKVKENIKTACTYESYVTGANDYSLELSFHSYNVALIASEIARALKLPLDEQEKIFELGNFHDIGKSRISKEILFKPGKLSEREFELIKSHSTYSAEIYYDIMENSRNREDLEQMAFAIQCHHENIDGSGYPLGLVGDEIPLYSKIIAIADRFEAVSHPRIYRETTDKPLQILKDMADNNKIDKEILKKSIPILMKYK